MLAQAHPSVNFNISAREVRVEKEHVVERWIRRNVPGVSAQVAELKLQDVFASWASRPPVRMTRRDLGSVKASWMPCRNSRNAGLSAVVQTRASPTGSGMSSNSRAFNRAVWLALMDSVRTATPSPLAARSATASGALACSTMSGFIFPEAQAWSNMVRGAVPSGMHTIGNALISTRLVRLRLASGWSNGTAATSRSLVIGRAEGHQYLDRVARSRLGTRAIRKLDARSCDEPYSWITPAPSSLWLPACGSHRRALA